MDELESREERNARDDDGNELLSRTWMKGILLYYSKHTKPIYKVITVTVGPMGPVFHPFNS